MISPSDSSPPATLSDKVYRELAALDTCSVANAIERFNFQLRNEGYSEGALTCRFPGLAPTLGYAMTLQVRSDTPPSKGRTYFESTDWWEALLSIPQPRILVIQDLDRHPGGGALVGEVHATILKALGCIGVVTNGAVRDLKQIEGMNFQMFAPVLSVSHSYSRIVHAGGPVRIGGLEIASGDILHGDRHGVLRVPKELAPRLGEMAATLREKEEAVMAYCKSSGFTLAGLRTLLNH